MQEFYYNIVARNSFIFSIYIFVFPRDSNIYLSIRSEMGDDSRTDEKLGSRQGRDISRCNDYLAQVGRFFISLRRSPQKKKSTRSFPSLLEKARLVSTAARSVQPRQYLRYSILFLKTEQRRHFKITMPATPPCIKDFSPCTEYL